ncbi:MAG: hypothetical protein LBP59_00350 [Planctomycetaceae bacterium]|nr:hypothetical protein [Planctomycetaceae bacterium]
MKERRRLGCNLPQGKQKDRLRYNLANLRLSTTACRRDGCDSVDGCEAVGGCGFAFWIG